MSLLNVEGYTRAKGLYVGAYLSPNFAQPILALCDALGLERPDASDLHCTVMYSREVAPPRLPAVKQAVNALVTSVQHWVGHNGQTYVVADVQSMAICQLHSRFARASARHSFPAYRPHITLGKIENPTADFEKRVDDLNWKLKVDPIHVAFMDIRARDVHDD